jgi:hypothetical protein
MISGTILVSIRASNLMVVAIPPDKTASTIRDGDHEPNACVTHKITAIGAGLRDISPGRIGNISFTAAQPNCFCRNRHHMVKPFPMGGAAAAPALFTHAIAAAAIPASAAIARSALKPYQSGEVRRAASVALF